MSTRIAPFISVVTPSLNQGPFIAIAIESVLRQGYPAFEHIIVDARSTDGTLDVLRAYQHLPTLTWTSESDRGQSHALNKGFSRSRGDWVLWLNADDQLADGALRAFARAVSRHPRASVFYGHQRFVDIDGRALKTVYHLPFRYPLVRSGLYLPPSTGSLYRKSYMLQNPLREDLHFVMDREWFLRCGATMTAVRINRTLSAFRVMELSKTGSSVMRGLKHPRHAEESRSLEAEYGYGRRDPSEPATSRGRVRSLALRAEYLARKGRFGVYYALGALSSLRHRGRSPDRHES